MILLACFVLSAWTESFETMNYFPPNDWIIVNEDALDALWYLETSVGHTGAQCATCYGDTAYSDLSFTNLDWLITPQILPQGNDTILSFYYHASSSTGCSLDVLVSDASPPSLPSFTVIQSFDVTETSWTQKVLSMNNYTDTPIYVAFRIRQIPTQEQFYLDDITMPSTTSQPTICNGHLRTKGPPSQKYLQSWGSHYDMGYAHGFLLAEEVLAGFIRLTIGTTSKHLITPYSWENYLRPYFNTQFFIPQKYQDEAQGLFDGLVAKGVDLYHPDLGRELTLEDIKCATAIADFIMFMCSSISGWGESTANDDTLAGGTIFVRDLDFYVGLDMTLANTSVIFAHNPNQPDEQRFITIGHSGWFACHSGINEEGVGLCIDVGNHPDTNYIPPASLKPIMLSCRDALSLDDPNNSGVNDIHDITHTIDHSTSLFTWDMHLVSPSDGMHPTPAGIYEVNNAGDSLRLVSNNNITPVINSQWNLVVTNHHRVLYPPPYCSRYYLLTDSINADFHLNTERAIALESVVAATYNTYWGHCTAQQMVFRPNIIVEHPDWPCVGVSYARRMSAANNFPKLWYSWDELFEGMPGIQEYTAIKPQHNLIQIYPNPFHHSTEIRFTMQDSRYTIQEAELSIYDISGRLVRSFNHESCIMNHGSAISWDGTDQADRQLGSGVYFVTLRTGNYSETRKVLLVR
jgi:hypothetical protein